MVATACFAACGLLGLCIGSAIQIDHPHTTNPDWNAAYWLSGLLIGLAVGVVCAALAFVCAYALAEEPSR